MRTVRVAGAAQSDCAHSFLNGLAASHRPKPGAFPPGSTASMRRSDGISRTGKHDWCAAPSQCTGKADPFACSPDTARHTPTGGYGPGSKSFIIQGFVICGPAWGLLGEDLADLRLSLRELWLRERCLAKDLGSRAHGMSIVPCQRAAKAGHGGRVSAQGFRLVRNGLQKPSSRCEGARLKRWQGRGKECIRRCGSGIQGGLGRVQRRLERLWQLGCAGARARGSQVGSRRTRFRLHQIGRMTNEL